MVSTEVKINAETARLLATFQADPKAEIRAMERVADAIQPLDINGRKRVLKWADERFTPLLTDGALSYAAMWAGLLGEMAQAVDAHRSKVNSSGRAPTEQERALFNLLNQWRGEPKETEAAAHA